MLKTPTLTALAVSLALIFAPLAAEAKGKKTKKATADKVAKTKNWPSKAPKAK